MIALAHAALDELGVPRACEEGRLTLFGRIIALRAGKYDGARLPVPVLEGLPPAVYACPRCGVDGPTEFGALCDPCAAALDA
jgi:hypothetical protein